MQPYFFPYIGYFQLINAVDKFIIYDDVNYIKGGWINRNNILINKEKGLITMNLIGVSQNKLINEIFVATENKKLLKTIRMAYAKAPFFNDFFPIIEKIINSCLISKPISEIAGQSLMDISNYLKISTQFEFSSKKYKNTKGMGKADRLIEICKQNGAKTYINAEGGKELYSKDYFKKDGIDLFFIKNYIKEYKQFNIEFIPYLSIIDVLMFNSIDEVKIMLNNYKLL